MAPLILHNVPDEELYVGDDGIQRPYAMIFPQQNGQAASSLRGRRSIAETGSFGKSSRRSRSKTGTPARREDPTVAAADKVFNKWFVEQATATARTSTTSQRPASLLPSSQSQPNLLAQSSDDSFNSPQTSFDAKEPTEVILRGYRSQQQQYAAINRFETIAGRICEDYPRDPPAENRRYKSELRDVAVTSRRALTPEERTLVNRADGGEHWVKVTFESAQAADLAIYSSPQSILGYLVFAEPYHGIPLTRDESFQDPSIVAAAVPDATSSHSRRPSQQQFGSSKRRPSMAESNRTATLSKSFTSPADLSQGFASPESRTSSYTVDSGTLTTDTTTSTASSATVIGGRGLSTSRVSAQQEDLVAPDGDYCRVIPSARRVKLLPADLALLPQPSYTQRLVNRVPFLRWFSGSIIGNQVPRTELGEFNWEKASLYWKIIWWLDYTFRLFGGEILNADKDD